VLQIAPTDSPYEESPTWTDLADHLNSFTITRGKQSEFSMVEAAEVQAVLVDRDGDFDPTNSGSIFAGDPLVLRQAQIQVPHPITGIPKNVFTGYIEQLDYARQGPRGATTTMHLVDGFELLANASVGASGYASYYAPAHVDDRIKAVLEDVGWPLTRARIATGNVNVQGIQYDFGTGALTVIQEAAQAEFPNVAQFFIDKDGNATFSGRFIRFNPDAYPDWITQWRVGDAPSCEADPTLLPLFDIETSIGKANLYNFVTCYPRNIDDAGIHAAYPGLGGVADGVSINNFGRRSLAIPDLLTLDGSTSGKTGVLECKDFALYHLQNYKNPTVRVDSIMFHGQMDDGTTAPGGASGALWDFILGVEINHMVTITTQNPGGGGLVEADYYVEGITHNVSRLNDRIPKWEMSLNLSPRALYNTLPT
jgi:hypothetical protein